MCNTFVKSPNVVFHVINNCNREEDYCQKLRAVHCSIQMYNRDENVFAISPSLYHCEMARTSPIGWEFAQTNCFRQAYKLAAMSKDVSNVLDNPREHIEGERHPGRGNEWSSSVAFQKKLQMFELFTG